MKTLLKPLSLALFVAAMLPTQNACNRTSPSSNPPTQNTHTQTSPPFDTIFAIGPSPSFRKAIGGPASEEDSSLIQTSDGGYAIAGETYSFGAGQADVYVVKLDANGNLQWTKTIGGGGGSSLIQTSDGGYAIAGATRSFGAGAWDVYVVKLDANGNLQWTKTIGGEKDEYGRSLIQTSDGGYAIAGKTYSFGAGYADVYVIKLDAHGNLQWTRTVGGPESEEGNSLIQTSDGGYAIAGSSYFGAADYEAVCVYHDLYVVKLDAKGNLQWTRTIDEPDVYQGKSLIQTSDGGYAIAGITHSPFQGIYGDVYLVKLDAKGNLQWTKTIGGEGWDEGYSLIQTSDGGYAIVGATNSFGAGGDDIYVVKLDAKGNLQWTKTIGGEGWDEGHSLIQTSDGGYAIAGATNSFGAGGDDIYVVKLDASGNLQWTKTIGGPKSESGLSLIQTSDGGYAIAGATNSFGAGETDVCIVKLDKNGKACCAISQTSQVGSGGRLGSPTPSIGSGGKLTSPTSRISSGGTLSSQCP